MASKPPCHGPGQASAGEAPSWALGRAGRAVGEHYGSAVVSRHKTEGIHHRLLVDRNTGRITQIELPGFRYYSDVSWYRDYAAYCAAADDGERVSAIVAQITTKKPIYKKQLEKLGGELPDAVCAPPLWQRKPIRVTFMPPTSHPTRPAKNDVN